MPVIISGWISLSNGGLFMPNSVLTKVSGKSLLSIGGALEYFNFNPTLGYPTEYFLFALMENL